MTRKNGSICVEMDSGHSVEGDLLLVATGRRPNTKALRVEAAGVALDDKGYVRVDKHFRTTTPHIYAIGDVTGQPAFTHAAFIEWLSTNAATAFLALRWWARKVQS